LPRWWDHCCVPLCTAGGRFNKMLSFHSFPKDSELRAQWLLKIRRDGFTVTTRSRVCSRHFETGEIFVSSSGKRCLQPKAVPSLFHWNNFSKKTERPGVWERRPRPVDTVAMVTVDYNTEDENDVSDMPITGYAKLPPPFCSRARYFQLTSCTPLSKRLLACPTMEH
uniref:THAP domain-containing protein 1 n=1 Tax=Oreochromis niloticus TaxID=8128 RepID=A0A669BMT0_ORENI